MRAMIIGLALVAAPAQAATGLKAVDSFRIGDSGVLCTAQIRNGDTELKSMFDRSYAVVCRDAATAVGQLYALRSTAAPATAAGECRPAAMTTNGISRSECVGTSGLPYLVLTTLRSGTRYVAQGFAGYESALMLGIQSLVADTAQRGSVEVTSTGAGDPTAFARVQAGTLDPEKALAEAYIRNNTGSFAEAAAFFETLIERNRSGDPGYGRSSEYLANQALQQSNLGNDVEAADLFARAGRATDASDPIQLRRLRNFRAIDQLNRSDAAAALVVLATPIAAIADAGLDPQRLASGYIDRPIAQKLNSDSAELARLQGGDERLTVGERAALLDAQSRYLEGVAYRSLRRYSEARAVLQTSVTGVAAVRQGRVRSLAWLTAAAEIELATIAEAEAKPAEARAHLDAAIIIYGREYPASAVLLATKARAAALLARQGQRDAAISGFRAVVADVPATPGAAQAIRPLIGPYFDLLVARGNAEDVAAFFDASQTLVRPGVAQTQAVLARELSGGNDAAAGLFRESTTVSREIIRAETDAARITAQAEISADDAAALKDIQARRDQLAQQQTRLLAKLSEFPRYRVVASTNLSLADLQAKLRKGEGYYKLSLVGAEAYGVFVSQDAARLVRVDATVPQLEKMVANVRDSIVRIENGRTATYPFDAVTSRKLYLALFGPVDAAVATTNHLIFEPDGPLLQLPVNLLIASDRGMAAFAARLADPKADAYDMTGIDWLGKVRMVSTAVSARGFVDLRDLAPSRGKRAYLGLGENAPAPASAATQPRDACEWPLATWGNPISAAELRAAAAAANGGRDPGDDLIIDTAFTDTAIAARTDLNQYRILHFATHGLVTAPGPQCPARPALVTSFGTGKSDGLLSFRDIFDLRLDADTVILSACDTAGMATIAATREAGISTGGNFALDGLVRAFVGAGSRTVIASHWPVPDDFGATGRLITGLFAGPKGAGVGEAMREASLSLMDDAKTSHPYYWAAFAIVGDAARPLQ